MCGGQWHYHSVLVRSLVGRSFHYTPCYRVSGGSARSPSEIENSVLGAHQRYLDQGYNGATHGASADLVPSYKGVPRLGDARRESTGSLLLGLECDG
jgi:hypothetical protein